MTTRTRCTPTRANFYLHDSAVGHTNGCIEVADGLIPLLKEFSKTSGRTTLLLQVTYPEVGVTDGNTERG